MLLLAGLMHRWLATFVEGDIDKLIPTITLLEDRASLRRRIECFTPAVRSSDAEKEAMYESCRWASMVLLAVEKLSIPIHVAAKHVQIRPTVTRRLRMTELSNLWGIRRGLLFWVTAVAYHATAGQCFPLLSTTLIARFAQEMAMLECCSEIAIKPLRKLKDFEGLCCRKASVI